MLHVGRDAALDCFCYIMDVGLVTEVRNRDHSVSMLGTAGYMAPEGPGTAAADVDGLGMSLYEANTGLERFAYPEIPADMGEGSDDPLRGLVVGGSV